MKTAVSYGLLGGLVLVVINLLIYLIDSSLMASWWVGILNFPITIAILVIAGLAIRRENGGFIKVGQAFVGMLITGIMMSLVSTVWQIILLNAIDPELKTFLATEALEQTYSMMEKFGMPEEQMKDALRDAEESVAQGFTISGQLMSVIWSAVWWALVSIIIALIIKKNPPLEQDSVLENA